MLTGNLELSSYQIGDVLWQAQGRIAYSAVRNHDQSKVTIETIAAQYPDRNLVASLRHEVSITQLLKKVSGVRDIIDTIPHGSGNLAIVYNHFDCTLAQLLSEHNHQGLPLSQVLNISLNLVETLGQVHRHDIIHKALAPEHILINKSDGSISLAGFAIASQLTQELQVAQLPKQLIATLPYMSPEQTGRMNRDLDYRSDYYSLGVLMFELLTGQQPFKATDTLDWVYSHICRMPPTLQSIQEKIPTAIADIVNKLLSKSPEQRYQNYQGLSYDLSHCINQLAKGEQLQNFTLGQRDVVQKFLVPQSLYGREQELEQLLDLFEQAVQGKTRFCLVHGYSGVGKSVLVNEIDRFQVRERGFLVQSKFDQFQQSEAYSALSETYRALVQQVLLLPKDKIAHWKTRLQNALAPNASLVIDLVPELELIIGPQPPVAELSASAAYNRLHMVLANFLKTVAGEGHPVVLFLDDLHWSDIPTLELLKRIVSAKDQSHLLLIGAYRSNEVPAGHPLHALLAELKSHQNIHDLPLSPLNRASVARLVADSMACSPDETNDLTQLLYLKAKGNPFFTNELLRQLHLQNVIRADANTGRWTWDLTTANWNNVSDDVVAFMLDNLRQLPKNTQKVLQLAACIGGKFDLQTLALIYEHSLADTANALLPALKQHTIQPLHNDYRLIGDYNDALDFKASYRFQHDKVQQAAYELIHSEQLAQVHLSIGRLIIANNDGQVANHLLTDVVGHLNKGRALITEQAELNQLAELNLQAGQRAKNATAYKAALNFLLVTEQLLPENAWQSMPEKMHLFATEIQQCYYLTGNIEQADAWIDTMLAHAKSKLIKSNILATRTRQYATLGRMEASISAAIQGLSLLGISVTETPSLEDISAERNQVDLHLAGREISQLVNAATIEEPETLVAMRLLMEIFPAAFLSGSGNLFPYLVLKSVNLSLLHGNCPESAFTYAAYGMLLCGELDEPALGYEYGKLGLAINERFNDISLRSRVIYVYAMFIHHWSNHWSSLTPLFKKGIEAGYQSGDLLYLAYSAQDCVIWDPQLDLETAETQHAKNLDIVRECSYQDSLDSGSLFLQFQRNLLGKTQSPLSMSDKSFNQERCLQGMQQRQFMTGIANHHIYNAEICFLYDDFARALHYVKAQDPLIKSAMSLPQLTRFYVVANLTLATHYPNMDAEEQKTTIARLRVDLARMTRWADNCEDNFRHLQYLMTAEIERIQSNFKRALLLYDSAIDAAKKSGFLRDEATACERAAYHLTAAGRQKSAEGYLRAAYGIYNRWGAKRKVDLLLKKYSVLRELTANNLNDHKANRFDIDLSSVMKASREISGEIVLENLLKRTLSIIAENAGAQWGCLVVQQQQGFVVEAVKLPEAGLPSLNIAEHLQLSCKSGDNIALPVPLINEAFHRDEALVINDALCEPSLQHDAYVIAQQARSILCVPLTRQRFRGVLYLENNLASDVFTAERVEIIRLLAAQAAVAIENSQLYQQVQEYSHTLEAKVAERTARLEELNQELKNLADLDGLTGVANRRRCDAFLLEAWIRLRREKQPMSVVMLDVDHFKLFNDNYGHQAGDSCLTLVATSVKQQLKRPDDMVARYGGEEFMLILPNTDIEGAACIAEAVRSAVEALAIGHAHSSAAHVVTLSLGCATATPGLNEDLTIERLVHQADVALYKAKQAGRNQVHLSSNL